MMAASLPARRGDLRTAVGRFLAWWSGELAELASAKRSAAREWRLMLLRSERGCDVYLRNRGHAELVGTSPAEGGGPQIAELLGRLGRQKIAPGQIVLRLRPDEVVQTRLSVPAAAREVLDAVVRNQIERHADATRQSVARKSLDLGLRHFSRADLEAARAAGQRLDIRVLGLASIAADVTPELAQATIASISVLGALQASAAVKAALADRTR